MKAEAHEMAVGRARLADFLELSKVRISVFVILSTLVGYVLGAGPGPDGIRLAHTLLATFLVSAGSAALNQYVEREHDARMERTADRPLPSGRMLPEQALRSGLLMLAAGLFYLVVWVNLPTAAVGALTAGLYVLVYTPLKRRTPLNTAVGAVAGALPPVGGWTAARGEVGPEALVLFGILWLWQFPHFYSIAWIHREDYARGGYCMVSVGDPEGDRTAQQIAVHALALLPLSLLPALMEVSGALYFLAATALGSGLIAASLRFARRRTDRAAKRLMQATLFYLPLLWLVMLLDRTP